MNYIAHNNIILQLTTLRELLGEIKKRKVEKIGITIDNDLLWALSRCVNCDKLLNDTIERVRDSKAEVIFSLVDPKKTRKYASKFRIPKGIRALAHLLYAVNISTIFHQYIVEILPENWYKKIVVCIWKIFYFAILLSISYQYWWNIVELLTAYS